MRAPEAILDAIRDRIEHPATIREIVQRLKIPRDERRSFKRQIEQLVEDGHLVRIRGNRYGLPDRMNLVVGRVETHPRGFGFVVSERPLDDVVGDVFIAGTNLNQAVHGDRVVARIERIGPDQRAEGRIVRILERAASRVVGRFDIDEYRMGFVSPFDRRLLLDIQVPGDARGGASPGDMVIVAITRWPTATRSALGQVVEVLGDISAPGVDTTIIIRKYGIADEHGDEAVEEARRLGSEIRPADRADRTDFRPWTTVTIDGEHARDFDDAISIEKLANGHFKLAVHIADVAHYVAEGSPLDLEAYDRATSVYFPERAVHMFPSPLATGLCSLNPHVDRLSQTCIMEIDGRGEVVQYEFHDGIINSDARLTYTAVNAVLTDKDAGAIEAHRALVPMFELMHELFTILNDRRRRRGSIDFDLPQAELVMDPAGLVEAIIAADRNVAHRLIEEFMLLANETVARFLDARDVPSLYRIHEEPDPLKVAAFEEFISTLGYSLAAPPTGATPKHFQRLVERIKDTPEEKPIAFLMLRSMQRARYDPGNLGHFGLAASSYTHFTSPIRRYPDLVVHRVLREHRHGRMDDERRQELVEELPEMARHTSERERRADDAERELIEWKKVRFMADKVGDEFEAFVTGVTAFGLFVELIEHFVEGLVHISTMADDYYRFLDKTHSLKGEHTGKVYRLGDRIRVQVIRVDLERRQIDLGLVEVLEAVRQAEGGRRAPKRPDRRKAASRPARGPAPRAGRRSKRRR